VHYEPPNLAQHDLCGVGQLYSCNALQLPPSPLLLLKYMQTLWNIITDMLPWHCCTTCYIIDMNIYNVNLNHQITESLCDPTSYILLNAIITRQLHFFKNCITMTYWPISCSWIRCSAVLVLATAFEPLTLIMSTPSLDMLKGSSTVQLFWLSDDFSHWVNDSCVLQWHITQHSLHTYHTHYTANCVLNIS